MGYLGGIVLLLICYFGFVTGDGDTRGLFDFSTDGGLNIRLVAILAAIWFAVFAIPVLIAVPELPPVDADASPAPMCCSSVSLPTSLPPWARWSQGASTTGLARRR